MISVLIPTYGRTALLNEALACFLSQTYTDAECVVLNDHAGQRLEFEHPRVRVINAPRFETIGAKRNELVRQAFGNWLCFWDDDDLYLPGHLQELVDLIPLFRGFQACKQYRLWIDGGHSLYRYAHSPLMHTLLMRRQLMERIGGYPLTNRNQDMPPIERLQRDGWLIGPPSQDERMPTCIVREVTGRYHLSDFTEAAALDDVAGEVAAAQEPQGVVTLCPELRADYHGIATRSWAAVQAARA